MQPLPPLSSQVSAPRYCYLEGGIVPSREIKVTCAGRELCDPDYVVDRTGFPCFGLEFVAEGVGQLVLDGHSHPLHAGVVFCYGPKVSHRIVNGPDRPMTKYFVDFFGSEAASLLRKVGPSPGRAMRILDVDAFRFLFDQLIAEGGGGGRNADAICAAYLRVILLKASGGISPSPGTIPATASQFHRWKEFIDTNFLKLRDLNDISAGLNVSPAQLCRVFKQYGQPGPFHYLTRRKLNRAAELLVNGRCSVKEAAGEVGYADPYHFSRLFKKHFGHAPLHFTRLFWRAGAVTPSDIR